MKIIVVLIGLTTFADISSCRNITEDQSQDKSKRTVADQEHSYGENKAVLFYDSTGTPTGLAAFYTPGTIKPVFEPDIPKQVAAQQVLYEFQQTPTNAVSNVHVNQFLQPIPLNQQNTPNSPVRNTNQYSAETVANPVQHSALIRHGQNFAQVQLPPQHIQTQQYIPGKYLYVNGKIIYPSSHLTTNPSPPLYHTQQTNHQQHLGQNMQQTIYPNQQQKPIYYGQFAPNQKLTPPPAAPIGYKRFQPPQKNQVQQITKPVNAPPPQVNEEQNDDEEDEESAPVREEDEEEEPEDKGSYHNDEEEDDRYFGKYAFDEDEDDHRHYEAEEEEEGDDDSEKGSSKHVPTKARKQNRKHKPYKYSKNYKFSESYKTSNKFETPQKSNKKRSRKPKMHHKTIRYMKQSSSKPKIERIEGKQSENVPVVHKQKVFKEKWYLTKSTADSVN